MNRNIIVFLFVLSLSFTYGLSEDLQCFVSGECIDSQHIDSSKAKNEFECLDICKSNSNCTWFTYFPHSDFCNLFANCTAIEDEFCSDCISGEQACLPPEPICWVIGECLGNLQHTEEDVDTKEECLKLCKTTEGCKWFTHIQSSSVCLLLTDCQTLDESCDDCFSGEVTCDEEAKDPNWHLIFGGNGYPGPSYLKSVELYNWQTGEQCQLSDLPIGTAAHSATIFQGVPVYCGGSTNGEDNRCYKLNAMSMEWTQISNLLSKNYYASGAYVPSQGWALFGGVDITLPTSQILKTIDGKWEMGPFLYLNQTDYHHCVVQINDLTTGFFGGIKNPKRILTLDWTTMEYTEHESQLYGIRESSACALLNGLNGETLVAIAGGMSRGLEVWNPIDDTITLLTTEFPKMASGSSKTPFMISINRATELVYYEEFEEEEGTSGIWRYFQGNNSWSKIGELLIARDDFVALPVTDIACPK